MYIDWVGNQLELLTDPAIREIRKIHVFATTLSFGCRVYAKTFPDEKFPSFIVGVVHALEYYGAIPKYLVPNNLNIEVSKCKFRANGMTVSHQRRTHFNSNGLVVHCLLITINHPMVEPSRGHEMALFHP